MPEGHTVHRTADAFNQAFAGKRIWIDSPQGRFLGASVRVSGQVLVRASAIGKQMFIEFDNGLFVRIHLGIYGKWQWHEKIRESGLLDQRVVGEVRARFYDQDTLAELRGPTVCEVINSAEVSAIQDRLGPDPLNPDPTGVECERFVNRVRKSTQSIAALLMDQSVISGIGNVYRAEILYRAGLDPYKPGSSLTVTQLREIWDDAVRLLAVGVRAGMMITRDELMHKRPNKADRNHVYKREGQECRACGTTVSIAILAGRKLYWCAGCQH
ncbi:MAG: Fpg/Nei family DNA glycosylase [Micrococcales bacterium]